MSQLHKTLFDCKYTGWNSVMEFMLTASAVAKAWSASLSVLIGYDLSIGCIAGSSVCPDLVAVAIVIVSKIIKYCMC